jgi:signal peptidase II
MLYAIIGMLVIIADQWIKFWVAGHLTLNEEVQTVIPGILSLVNVHNDGAAFGFLSGSGARIPFIILAGVFAVAVIIALATKLISGKLARWSIVLVTAGGLSNCLDRVIYGYVQDMFKLEFINFPVFNLADVFITVFAILFALAVIFGKTRKDVAEDDFFDEEDEEDEEEEAPKVSRRKQRREKRRAAAAQREAEEDEEEEEEAPVKKPKKANRKQRKSAEAEVEEAAPAPAPKIAAKQQADPFADWDRANAKADAVKARRSEVVAAASRPAAKPAPAQKPSAVTEPVRTNAQAAAAVSAQSAAAVTPKAAPAKPAAKPAAAPKPAAKPAAKPVVEEEFSLDDILNEFK